MSPIMMALMGLIAYKAMKGLGGGAPQGVPGGGRASPMPGGGGGIGDILGGLLGGRPSGGVPQGLPQGMPQGMPGGGGGGLGDLLGGLLGGGGPSSGGPFGGGRPGGAPSGGGGLGGLLPGALGGLLGGGAGGSVLSGGLGNIIKDLQNGGHGRVAQSWVGTGANEELDPQSLEAALGVDTIDALAQHTGMDRDEMLEGLSQHLPHLVDQLTPGGQLPTDEEAEQMI
jgi:uncharacterized protein YidB (DUF937 family)